MIVEFVDKLDNAFDAADNDDRDIAEDKFFDNREDTVKGVESSGDNTTTDEPLTSAFFSSPMRPTYRFWPSLGSFCRHQE